MPIDVRRKLLKWGNGYGLRLTAKEAAELQAGAGDQVHARIENEAKIDNRIHEMPTFDFGPGPHDIDAIVQQDFMEEFARMRKTPAKRGK